MVICSFFVSNANLFSITFAEILYAENPKAEYNSRQCRNQANVCKIKNKAK